MVICMYHSPKRDFVGVIPAEFLKKNLEIVCFRLNFQDLLAIAEVKSAVKKEGPLYAISANIQLAASTFY